MSDSQRQLFLLGPQPNYESLKTVISKIELRAPIALITAGWETGEHEDNRLQMVLGGPSVNLSLFSRTEQLFAEDPDLIQSLQTRQDELRHLRDAYKERLNHLLKAARKIIRRPESLTDLQPERESAIEMVRQLDREYFVRTSQIVDKYEERLQIADRPLVATHRAEIADILERSSAIIIAGGHVAIILNRLKIFGILEMCPELPIIAWSGGAMALSGQVVFFHDSPPQGAGDPEVLRAGTALYHEFLPLPDANSRLDLQDQARIELFARRFNQYFCVLFDEQTILERSQDRWTSIGEKPVSCLGTAGNVVGLQL